MDRPTVWSYFGSVNSTTFLFFLKYCETGESQSNQGRLGVLLRERKGQAKGVVDGLLVN